MKHTKQIIFILSFIGILGIVPVARAGVPVTIVGDLVIKPFLDKLEHKEKKTEFTLRSTVLPVVRNMILNGVKDSDTWVKNWPDFVWGEAKRQNQQALDDFFAAYKTVEGLPASLAKVKLGLEQQLYGTGQKAIERASEVGQEAANNVFNAQKCGQNGKQNCYDAFVDFIDKSDYVIANTAEDVGLTVAAKTRELQQTVGTAGQGYLGKTTGSGLGAEIVTPATNIARTVQRAVDNEIERLLAADNCWEVLDSFGDVVDDLLFSEGMLSGARSTVGEAAMGVLDSQIAAAACEFLDSLGL